MKTFHRFLVVAALAGFLHLVLGWEWTAAAGFVAGSWMPHRAWLFGAAVVGLDYLVFVLFSVLNNASAVGAMAETMGGLLGNMPSFIVVALTVLIGALIGALSAAAGSQLRRVADRRRGPAQTVPRTDVPTVD